jgi:hypothetical protein
MTDTEMDVEALRGELDQIKDAMGLEERYEGASKQWLLFGALVPVAAALSQYVHLQELSGLYHGLIWFGVLGGGSFVGNYFIDDPTIDRATDNKPRVLVVFAATLLAFVPIQLVFADALDAMAYRPRSVRILALILVLLGVVYIVFGETLRAYYIRRRDRYALQVGGVWMILLGAFLPAVPVLETWGFAAFGGCYFVYAIGAYLVLSRGDGG